MRPWTDNDRETSELVLTNSPSARAVLAAMLAAAEGQEITSRWIAQVTGLTTQTVCRRLHHGLRAKMVSRKIAHRTGGGLDYTYQLTARGETFARNLPEDQP